MSDDFYRAFEERHYAPREFIKKLRKQYLPFITPLNVMYPGAPTFDIGCGRGEWLELMTEIGFKPYGVDLDEGMLKGCLELGLPAEKGDAVAFITTLPSESQAVVTAFHVVEHITFEQLRTVVSEALRVLKPGGMLIMETPNPENIRVGTENFYLDPTHQRPIPLGLLSFLPEYYGFARIKTIRLQESKDLIQSASLTLHDVLTGVSPDYAIVAQKSASAEQLPGFGSIFEKEHGVSLADLAIRYEARIQEAETRTQEAETRIQEAETRIQEAETRIQENDTKIQEADRKLAIIWRLIRPLRWLKRNIQKNMIGQR